MAAVRVYSSSWVVLLSVVFCTTPLKAGGVALPFFEGFNTPTTDAVATYPQFTADQGGSGIDPLRFVNANGVLRFSSGGFPYYPALSVTPDPFPTGEIVIKVDMGWNGQENDPPVGIGFGGTALRLGTKLGLNGLESANVTAFHPGYTSPPGAFRVEGDGGFGTTNMGWVPAVGVLHHVEIHSFPNGLFQIKVTDGNNPSNVFNTSFTNPDAYGGDIGLLAFAGGSAMYDNLYISLAGVPLLGDYNDNGFVDAADYVAWRKGGTLLNESETIGSSTPEDYDYWRSHFGAPAAGSGSSSLSSSRVPEPSSLFFALVGAVSIAAAWRRRFV